jgi:hypothetical protein
MAPASSSTPVTVTSSAGAGRPGGTMLMSSARIPTKWDTPVSTNIAASPPRTATGHGRSRRTPAAPAASNTSVTAMRTTSGAMRFLPQAELDSDKMLRSTHLVKG